MNIRKTALLLLLTGLLSQAALAQKFWLTTYCFPDGPKTGIALVQDTILFAGLTDGVLRSTDEGVDCIKVLSSGPVFGIHATEDGVVLAGGFGKIYVSDDYGDSWDSVAFQPAYPVTGFTHLDDGSLFAITGALDIQLGFVGAGVFYSGDMGYSWAPRNDGLGIYLSCSHIAADRFGRLYLAVYDEYLTGNGGLFVSEDKGLNWEHIDITIDGEGIIENEVKTERCTGLSISPQDSLYISLQGKTGTAQVRLNLVRHLDDLHQPGFWQRIRVGSGPSWWLDRTLNGIHFAQNGDRYSSASGTLTVGGTYFSQNKGASWNQQLQGLGLDMFGFMNVQHFAERSSGKVFMVQYLDERIYWADTSQISSGLPGAGPAPSFRIHPNPVQVYGTLTLTHDEIPASCTITLFDLQGRILSQQTHDGRYTAQVDMPAIAGPCFLQVRTEKGARTVPLMVH